eukprot:TRINITY_DN21042_c0_g1_i1.p1 TRINITY_DN21042_c0_g1~~TRINITY_DN21042_c0_g1_i1.p1  ORF type:complete len:950 (+),score=178.04 TRINITY_DN21042_c0_g1_i1:110-2851(+)
MSAGPLSAASSRSVLLEDAAAAVAASSSSRRASKSATSRGKLLRAPRMDAKSGVWLEGMTKQEGQVMLMAFPWALVVGALLFEFTLWAAKRLIPELAGGTQMLERCARAALAVVCAGYMVLTCLFERSCCCCSKNGPRRSLEGWMAMLALLLCAAFQAAHAREDYSAGTSGSGWLAVVRGSMIFRLASTAEFVFQLAWLYAADRIRYDDQVAPQWKGWGRCVLLLIWSLTFVGVWNEGAEFTTTDDRWVLAGASARWVLFLYCVAHASKKTAKRVLACGCLNDWSRLVDHPFTPGSKRLRCLAYYLLTRPPFLVLVNLPLGYPVVYGAEFATTIRCGFALLMAMALRPAPRVAIGEHQVEKETREHFDISLALRLCDFAWETYSGPPPSQSLIVSGSQHTVVNGEYVWDGRSAAGACLYSKKPTPGLEKEQVYLRPTGLGEWEFSSSKEVRPGIRWAYTTDDTLSPEKIEGLWFERTQDADFKSNDALVIKPGPALIHRRYSKHGGCKEWDVHWLVVEEDGALEEPCKVGLDASADPPSGGERPEHDTAADNVVSLVVAFRGTNSLSNVLTDATFRLRNLGELGELDQAGVPAASPSSASAQAVEDAFTDHADVEQGLQVPRVFDLQTQLGEELRRVWTQGGGGPEIGSPRRRLSSGTAAPAPSAETVADASDLEDDGDRAAQGSLISRCLYSCCLLCLRSCGCLLFPFTAKDVEDTDLPDPFAPDTVKQASAHSGFLQAYRSVRHDVMAVLQDRLQKCAEEGKEVCVYVTGHSMGGAMASVCAMDAATLHQASMVSYTFGSPRLGNASFRSAYNALVPDTFRVVASRDVIPSLPPSISYRHLGREVFADDAGELTYTMSWAMRHVLPSRDSFGYHPLTSYYRLLGSAFERAHTGRRFLSAFQQDLAASASAS